MVVENEMRIKLIAHILLLIALKSVTDTKTYYKKHKRK